MFYKNILKCNLVQDDENNVQSNKNKFNDNENLENKDKIKGCLITYNKNNSSLNDQISNSKPNDCLNNKINNQFSNINSSDDFNTTKENFDIKDNKNEPIKNKRFNKVTKINHIINENTPIDYIKHMFKTDSEDIIFQCEKLEKEVNKTNPQQQVDSVIQKIDSDTEELIFFCNDMMNTINSCEEIKVKPKEQLDVMVSVLDTVQGDIKDFENAAKNYYESFTKLISNLPKLKISASDLFEAMFPDDDLSKKD